MDDSDIALRMRLFIGPSAPELQRLHGPAQASGGLVAVPVALTLAIEVAQVPEAAL